MNDNKVTEIDSLCTDLLLLKEQEKEIANVRIEVENQIARLISTRAEGTDKAETGSFKVTVTSKLTRSLDYPAYLAIEKDLPAHMRCVDLKPAINLKNLRILEQAYPDIPAHFISSKPAKPQVKVEVIA